MFPSIYDIKRKEPQTDLNSQRQIQSMFQPHITPSFFSVADFEGLSEMLEQMHPRTYLLFGASKGLRISGLEPRTYTVTCDFHTPFQKEERQTKKVDIRHATDGDYCTLFMTYPLTSPISHLLDRIKENEDGTLSCGSSLIERAKRFDDYLAKNPHTHLRNHMHQFFDPDEVALWDDLNTVYISLNQNTILAQYYFRQMASLMLLGRFDGCLGMKTLTGIKGTRPDNIETIVSTWALSGFDKGLKLVDLEVPPQQNKDLVDLLAAETPWYKNPKLTKPLNISVLIREFNHMGRASRMRYEEGSGTAVSSVAAESIINEIYQSATGKESQRSDTFETKLKTIAKTLDGEELLQPYVEVYKAKGKITPAIIRGGVIHTGSPGQGNLDDMYDRWTQYFYNDLIKTIITLIAGHPRAYFDFDKYGRWMNLIGNKEKPASFVPVDISKPFDHFD